MAIGKVGKVKSLPPELEKMESETMVRVAEIEFEDEQGNETIDLFDVHCGDEILQCYSDDLEQVKDKKHVSSACPPGNKTRVREQLRRVVSYTFKTNTK